MKTVSVTGGKGGTGKSTYAILLAFKAITEGKKVLLVDCDVECPNDFILLGIDKLQNPAVKTYSFYPVFDKSKCTHCGLCVKSCRSSAIFQPKGQVPILNEDLCTSCGVCWNVCPFGAISKEKKLNGEVYENEISDNFTLVTGRSITGVRETSPVVEQTREYVDQIKEEFDMVIIDTAAGTHCTVMSALEETEKAFVVTEPTPLGAHDLNVMLKVLKVLNIPSEIVLNRSDVGEVDLIEKIGNKNKVKITKEIPYSKLIADSYAGGNFWEDREKLINLI